MSVASLNERNLSTCYLHTQEYCWMKEGGRVSLWWAKTASVLLHYCQIGRWLDLDILEKTTMKLEARKILEVLLTSYGNLIITQILWTLCPIYKTGENSQNYCEDWIHMAKHCAPHGWCAHKTQLCWLAWVQGTQLDRCFCVLEFQSSFESTGDIVLGTDEAGSG